MRAPGSTIRTRGAAGAAAIGMGAVVAVQLVLVWAVLSPRTFFSGDPGVKYLQAVSAAQSGWRDLSLRNPAAEIDPDRRFDAFALSQVNHRGTAAPTYGEYAESFTLPASVAWALFGTRGLYLVPLLASLGTMLATYRLSRRTAPRAAWVAPLLVGACSPMLFYSVDLWEHTLATMFSTAAVLWFVAGTTAFDLRRCALAGLAFGAAMAVREELFGFAPAILVALAWVERRRWLPAVAVMAATAPLALLPQWGLKWMHTGHLVRRPLEFAFRSRVAGDIASLATLPSWHSAVELLVPLSPTWWLLLAVLGAARLTAPRTPPRWCSALLLGLAGVVAVWASADVLWLTWKSQRPVAVLAAFPVTLFLCFLPPRTAAADGAAREVRQLLAIAFVYAATVCLSAPFTLVTVPAGGAQWGPRFLMPLYPLLAVAIAFALERRTDWTARVAAAPRRLAATFAVLAAASAALQAQSIRDLYHAKAGYERLVRAIEAVDPNGVVATDLWWFPSVTAAVLYEHPTVLVDSGGNGALPELLPRLPAHGVAVLALVSAGGGLGRRHAQALAEAGWTEVSRQRVPIWLDVDVVSYRRGPPPV
jgi:hypothetical protein